LWVKSAQGQANGDASARMPKSPAIVGVDQKI